MSKARKTRRHPKAKTQPAAQPITFVAACKYLFDVIKWKFSPRQYIGRNVFIYGKMRPIIAEKYSCFFVKGLSHAISKKDRYILQP